MHSTETENDAHNGAINSMPIPDPPYPDDIAEQLPMKKKSSCWTSLKIFLAALSFAYFTKTFSGSYMKSSITQIERRFDIPSSIVGMVDGSFEMGNLLMIAFVSYFGAKWHRPKVIAAGCLTMSIGSFLSALPHFFMGYYEYETIVNYDTSTSNSTSNLPPCLGAQNQHNTSDASDIISGMSISDCEKVAGSNLWIIVFLGNLLRGIGETPIMPLGISYLDDFSKDENTAFYIACLHTISIIGLVPGFMLGSLCANLYVDIGFVNVDDIIITPQDSRWVGAWWLGFLVVGTVTLFSAIPFCFLPMSLIKEGKETSGSIPIEDYNLQGENMLLKSDGGEQEQATDSGRKTGFFTDLLRLFGNPIFTLYMIPSLLQFGSYAGFSTYKPKYMEQQYGQSMSKSNFIMGVTGLPALAAGVFVGGLIMKKCKFNLLGTAKFAIWASAVAYLLTLSVFAMGCKSNNVAGVTVTYEGNQLVNLEKNSSFSTCNSDCNCKANQWDPVCGDNGMTYISACLAGCTVASGSGRNTVYHNCTCIGSAASQSEHNSVILGECPREEDCSTMLIYFTIVEVIASFIYAVGGTPAFMIVFRCVDTDLKSLAVGVFTLVMRTLGGIPAPIYFGALIDTTCLMWGSTMCGSQGACRIYNARSYREAFLGLTAGMRGLSVLLTILIIIMLKKQFQARENKIADHDTGGGCELHSDANLNCIAALEVETHEEASV